MAEARHIVESGDAPDDVLVARVRAKLGRLVDRPHDIETLVVDGVVTLRGKVNAERMEQLVYGVSNVHGVRGVHNQLLGSGPEPAQFGGFGKAIAGFGLALGVVKLLRRA